MKHSDDADGENDRTWKQTMNAFWNMFENGTLVTTKECYCGVISPITETFHTLFLGFEERFHGSVSGYANQCNLSDMISYYHQESRLEWACPSCMGKFNNATKKCVITKYPKILYIVIQRGGYNMLINTAVDFPLENFNPFIYPDGNEPPICDVKYNLVASIYRKATTQNKGHYYAICKDDRSGSWYTYDDDNVEVVKNMQKPNGKIYVTLQRNVDVLVYIQQDAPMYHEHALAQFSSLTTGQDDSMSSVSGANSREGTITVCNE